MAGKTLTTRIDVPGPSSMSSITQQSTARAPTNTLNSHPSQVPTKPNYDPFASISSSHPSSRTSTPVPSAQSHPPAQSSKPSLDPFASLSSRPPQKPSPSLNSQRSHPSTSNPPSSLIDMASSTKSPATQPTSTASQHTNGASADDEWNFSSALPEDNANLPPSNDVVVANNQIGIVFSATRLAGSESSIHILASFSNRTAKLVTEYTFEVAVTKVRTLPQSLSHLQEQVIDSDHRLIPCG